MPFEKYSLARAFNIMKKIFFEVIREVVAQRFVWQESSGVLAPRFVKESESEKRR